MILVDANLLIYAHNEQAQQHAAARAWLEEVLAGSEPIALPWSVVLAFLRIVTDGRIIRPPLGMAEAVAITTGWFEDFGVFALTPGEQHWQILQDLIAAGQCSGALLSDAHLAAMAIERGATLCTADQDFSRFPGLRRLSPL